MKILFLDQSGKPGGAELCLADIATPYKETCLVGLFSEGDFKALLQNKQIPTQLLTTRAISVRKASGIVRGIVGGLSLLPLLIRTVQLAQTYDLIYANTQKALVVGALASFLSRRPLVYHLHDILSRDHFSPINRRLAVTLANRLASLVIANSHATQTAFIEAGGRKALTAVVYNGFDLDRYRSPKTEIQRIRQQLGLNGRFVVGHFSRLSPWKGQHILLEALVHCSKEVTALFVGDCLFGEQDYAEQLRQQVKALKLEDRVRFLGFRSDIVQLMQACDLIAHTSTAPEPFGRVIVEAMLCGRPVVGSASGGAIELIEAGETGWLFPPGNSRQLAEVITCIQNLGDRAQPIARKSQIQARQRFDLQVTNQQIARLLSPFNELN